MTTETKHDVGNHVTNIKFKVLPRSSRNQVIGKGGDVFKVKLTSPPVEGRANKALIELLSKKLRIAKSRVEIVSGRRSKVKSVRIHGLSLEDVTALLEN